MSTFETPAGTGLFGTLDPVVVEDPDEPGTPEVIIQEDDPFRIAVKWSIGGEAAPMLGGTWHVNAYLDDIDGVGPSSGLVASADVPLGPNNGINPRPYSVVMDVPANKVKAGLYELTVAITYDNGGPGPLLLEMAAFSDDVRLQFYHIDQS